jgi:hypothetical protein
MQELEKLQDHVPSFDCAAAKRIIESELSGGRGDGLLAAGFNPEAGEDVKGILGSCLSRRTGMVQWSAASPVP